MKIENLLGVLYTLVLISVAALIGFSVFGMATEIKLSGEQKLKQQTELTERFGPSMADRIVELNCDRDIIGMLNETQDGWDDNWCAIHYGHLINNRASK